jgi:hypothetical protein
LRIERNAHAQENHESAKEPQGLNLSLHENPPKNVWTQFLVRSLAANRLPNALLPSLSSFDEQELFYLHALA